MFRDAPWPGNVLSNFAATPFTLDGVSCANSEAFIQSLKLTDPEVQRTFCGLAGEEAWRRGSKLTAALFERGCIHWQGAEIELHCAEHFVLVKRGLAAKFSQSEPAREALLASGEAVLTHDYGQVPGKQQSLPVEVFCRLVTELRAELKE